MGLESSRGNGHLTWSVTDQVAGGAGSYTSPQTRPAKIAVATNEAQLQSSSGPLLASLPKHVDKIKKPARPA